MNKLNRFLFTALLGSLFVISGCAPKIYNWNGYDDSLYRYYKNPEEKEKFIGQLALIIAAGEKSNNVPPGIYAEYGYMLYEDGKYRDAINYFQKEHDRWPESKIFMSKMIRNAKNSLERQGVETKESSSEKKVEDNKN